MHYFDPLILTFSLREKGLASRWINTKYQLNKSDLVAVIQALFKEPNIRFENGQVVWLALNDYRNAQPVSGKMADFSDALIVNKAKSIASDKSSELRGVYTFDIAAQQLPGTKAPSS